MEKFILIILCSSFYSLRATRCTPNLAPCSDIHDIGTITCAGGEDECIAAPDEIAGLLGEAGSKIKAIDAGTCKELCRDQADAAAADPSAPAKCAFYRWEEENEGKCILQTECGVPDIRCQSLDVPRCITGEVGCTEDGTTACHLESPVDYDPDLFHLICHGDGSVGDINIYTPDNIDEIPTGTECYTIHKCAQWDALDEGYDPTKPKPYYRKLAVRCNDGTFEAITGKTGDDVQSGAMVQANKLVEPKCEEKCGPLVGIGTIIGTEGTELICEEDLDGINLQDGNSCILLCDNHFAMSISCQFEPEGTKIWKDENREVVTENDVHC